MHLMHFINLMEPSHKRVQHFISRMFHSPTLVAPAAILFGGERWHVVEVVAMLSVNGKDCGIATLAPTDEIGNDNPHIIGLWIDPEMKASQHSSSYGVEMLARLAQESLKRYQRQATFVPVSHTEHTIAHLAKERSIPFSLQDIGGPFANW